MSIQDLAQAQQERVTITLDRTGFRVLGHRDTMPAIVALISQNGFEIAPTTWRYTHNDRTMNEAVNSIIQTLTDAGYSVRWEDLR